MLALAAAAAVGPAAPAAVTPSSEALVATKAAAIRIVLPGGRVVASQVTTAGASSSPAFSYPRDGSVIVTGSTRAATSLSTGRTGRAKSSSAAANISIFDGEITADSAAASAAAAAGRSSAGGGFAGTAVVNLQAFGRPHAHGRVALEDWGYLTIAQHVTDRTAAAGTKGFDGTVVALDIHLTAAHGGLAAGSEIQVGYAQAVVQTAPPPVPVGLAGPHPGDRPQLLPPATGPLIGVPQLVQPSLDAGPYVFPVFGQSHWSDTYGTWQGDAPYQHGVDILGTLGQPLVAAAGGTLFSVGWNHAAGNRLRLRDRQGNTFYYAHLSAFSALVRNGAHVKAGQVIGFMGDTGNPGGLPSHLHFEVHPLSMLFLGSDGAVDPAPYLASWRRLASLSLTVGSGWAPTVPGTIKPPEPAVVPIGVLDISSADGLDPASLRRVVAPSAHG